jgi:anaerobic ribonucleoside-triphosphate reductase activating protein
MDVSEIYNEIKDSPHNVTISGGDPLLQWIELKELLKLITHTSDKTIWVYTGFKWEELSSYKQFELAQYVDVLVDGRFELDKKDLTLPFRGSSNQRLIDVRKSVKENKVVLWEENDEEDYKSTF